jgi:REP-associated tyrosine transposase
VVRIATPDFRGQVSRMTFRRKNIRFRHDNYVGKGWFFVTMCCFERRSVFQNVRACDWFLNILQREVSAHLFAAHAYCLMPDHVHLLVEGLEPNSDLLQFLRVIKMKSTTPFERETGSPLWQKKFYDHILRQNDSADGVAWYIWMNPVRAGLCGRPEEYPFVGSFTGLWPKTPKPFVEWLPPWRKMPATREMI